MKKLICIALALVMVLGLAVTVSAEGPRVTLTYAEVNPIEGTIVGMIATYFKEQVETLTNGSVCIDIQANGVLGNEASVLDGILSESGTVDISRISAFALTSYGCNKAKLLSIPYTFVNEQHFWNFANSDLAQEFLKEPQELDLGLRGLCYGEEGFRHFFFKEGVEINSIEDLKGLKIRVSEDPVMVGMVKDLGAKEAVVPFTELYSALQTGVVDGAEQPIANYKSNAFPEVAPTIVLDGHTLGAIQIVITDLAWDKLTEEEQAAVMEAARLTQAYNAEIVAAKEQEVKDALIEAGCSVVEIEDKAPWVEACQNTITKNTSDQAVLYQQLLDLQ